MAANAGGMRADQLYAMGMAEQNQSAAASNGFGSPQKTLIVISLRNVQDLYATPQ